MILNFRSIWLKTKERKFIYTTGAAGLILAGLGLLAIFGSSSLEPLGPEWSETVFREAKNETQAGLTADKISRNAAIIINLPPFSEAATAAEQISFEPAVAGRWLAAEEGARTLAYKPDQPLDVGQYYAVTLASPAGELRSGFIADEDPAVAAVFPPADSEADENSVITIIFNRPVVALSALDIMDEYEAPAVITPATPGRGKWTSTRTWQFIPDSTLFPSAHYEIAIKPDLVSLDGLTIKPMKSYFDTRRLDYQNNFQDNQDHQEIVYNQAFLVYFNQPVNLDKTRAEIRLSRLKDQKDFILEYYKSLVYNPETKKDEVKINESVLAIYQKADAAGRPKFWDEKAEYQLSIKKVFPKSGDITLKEARDFNFAATAAIRYISARSERSRLVGQDLFDPEGELLVDFYEDIDLDKSALESAKKMAVRYGEQCRAGQEWSDEIECAKEENRKQLVIKFDRHTLKTGEKFDLVFSRLVNHSGETINRAPIVETIKVFPVLEIKGTAPAANSQNAPLNAMTLCTNAPLVAPAKEEIKDYVRANRPFEWHDQYGSFFVAGNQADKFCRPGEYRTDLSLGLQPDSDYRLVVKALDPFGQSAEKEWTFLTGPLPDAELMFYHLQEKYNILPAGQGAKLAFAVENMDYVNLEVCRLKPEKMLEYLFDRPSYYAPIDLSDCLARQEKKIILEKKYWVKNYFQVDLSEFASEPSGHYLLTFSHPRYREQWGERRPVFERTYFSFTDLSVVEKKVAYVVNDDRLGEGGPQDENLYWVVDGRDLAPIVGATVDVYKTATTGLALFTTATTDAQGIARSGKSENLAGAVIRQGGDSALVTSAENNFGWARYISKNKKFYVYTDRPIYRPGDTVRFKGLYRIGYDGFYEISQAEIDFSVKDSAYQDIYRAVLSPNDFGAFQGEFVLPASAPLGPYSLRAEDDYTGSFDVQEYRPAPFQVSVNSDREEYFAGDQYAAKIQASYYFGAPVAGGEVQYNLASQDYHFDRYQDEYFSFGAPWYDCYYDCSYNDKFLLRGQAELDSQGRADIAQILDFNRLFPRPADRQSKIFVLSYTVKNTNGQTVSGQHSFIVHAGDYYLGIKADKYFAGKNENFGLAVKTVDTTGAPAALDNLELSINLVEWVSAKRREVDGAYYYTWEEKLTPVETRRLATDKKGNWRGQAAIAGEGEYRLIVKAADRVGRQLSGQSQIYIFGEGRASVRPDNDNTLDLTAAKQQLKTGEQAQIIIPSPFAKAKALISLERGKIFSYEIVDVSQSYFDYSFPIKSEYIPNIYGTVTLLAPGQRAKYGSVNFLVNTAEKELKIEVQTKKSAYYPGEEVILDLNVRDYLDQPAEAELSVAVVDLSVLALKGNPKKNPLVFFYGGQPLAVYTSANSKNLFEAIDIKDRTKGGGGLAPQDLAKKKRGDFRDTAFWQADLRTDQDGRARAIFTLPDNLTTWQAEVVGLTKDTKVGVQYRDWTARKELMAVPLAPRFIIPGDEFALGAEIFNQSDDNLRIDVEIESATLDLDGAARTEAKIGAHSSAKVYFPAAAPTSQDSGEHVFTITARAGQFLDRVENRLPIRKNQSYEAVATAGRTKNDRQNEYLYLPAAVLPDQGSLAITTSATLAVFLSDSLEYLLGYPYGCAEQIASKLAAAALIKQAMSKKNINNLLKVDKINWEGQEYSLEEVLNLGLTALYQDQTQEGGFAYYANGQADLYLSLYVLSVFHDVVTAGQNVNQDVLARLNKYLLREFSIIGSGGTAWLSLNQQWERKIKIAETLSLFPEFFQPNKNNWRINQSNPADPNTASSLLLSLAALMERRPSAFSASDREAVLNGLRNRIRIDARGAFLPVGKNHDWRSFDLDVTNTARLLTVLERTDADDALSDRLLRWILTAKQKDGSWGSTNATAVVVKSFLDFLLRQKENEADFSLAVSLNGQGLGDFSFGPENIFAWERIKEPVSALRPEQLNSIGFAKTAAPGRADNFYYDIAFKYFLPANALPARDEGLAVERNFFRLADEKMTAPLDQARVGEVLKGRLRLSVPADRDRVLVEDFIPAGVELVNFALATENVSLLDEAQAKAGSAGSVSSWLDAKSGAGPLWPEQEEKRDDRLVLFLSFLPAGTYDYFYYVRALVPGKFNHLPAVAAEMYRPENFGRTDGRWFVVEK